MLNPISTPPHSRSLVFATSINGLSGSSLRQFPLTRFSSPSSSSSSNYLNGWIPTTATPTPETPHRRNPLLSPSPRETKTPNFHPPPLLLAAMHPPSAPPAVRPALRVRSPRPRTGRVRHSCLDRMIHDVCSPSDEDRAKWLVESALVLPVLFQERCEEEFLSMSEMIKIRAADLKSKEQVKVKGWARACGQPEEWVVLGSPLEYMKGVFKVTSVMQGGHGFGESIPFHHIGALIKVRVNTRLLYQQTKFNLLREESEGYAKLVTMLCHGCEESAQNALAATVGIMKSLIGHFDLDPNRVFDIVLECFELQPDNCVFLDLIPIFPKSHASQILGFKFQYYQRMEVNHHVSLGLYKLTALLVKEEFIDLDSIYPHLLPKDDEANKIGNINLAATGKDLMEDEKQGDVTIDLSTDIDLESEAVTVRASELENNQTFGLLTGFLSVNDCSNDENCMSDNSHITFCWLKVFLGSLKSLSSAYELVRQTHLQNLVLPSAAVSDSMETNSYVKRFFVDLPKELVEMLSCAGPYLYCDTLLLQKVCRVLKGYYLSALERVRCSDGSFDPESGSGVNGTPRLHLKEARLRIEEALGTVLLPLQLTPANSAVGQEIWDVLLPSARYGLYGEWEKDDERIPMVLAARQTAKLDTRRILKRLVKELKQLGRMVAKLAHANPMTVLRTIVHQWTYEGQTVVGGPANLRRALASSEKGWVSSEQWNEHWVSSEMAGKGRDDVGIVRRALVGARRRWRWSEQVWVSTTNVGNSWRRSVGGQKNEQQKIRLENPENTNQIWKEIEVEVHDYLANIVQRRGYKLVKDLLEASAKSDKKESHTEPSLSGNQDISVECEYDSAGLDKKVEEMDEVFSSSEVSVKQNYLNSANGANMDCAVNSDSNGCKAIESSTNSSLHEKVAKFIQNGELDPIEGTCSTIGLISNDEKRTSQL
ncbi:hypothetical protein RHGRI_011505 [Rhododendron griersonianum]|uniref:THO complex subunit 2 N-terminal domain-containing protein n=1 Tax=Rhododendron griersonianum TaxID=479676 RepID=A0AAV6KN40_9ERIC|nr:hypothetical protein RHGRI_011505 [Rhododendron griersonianum]